MECSNEGVDDSEDAVIQVYAGNGGGCDIEVVVAVSVNRKASIRHGAKVRQ